MQLTKTTCFQQQFHPQAVQPAGTELLREQMLLGSDIHTIPVLEYGFFGKVCLGSVLVGLCLFVCGFVYSFNFVVVFFSRVWGFCWVFCC